MFKEQQMSTVTVAPARPGARLHATLSLAALLLAACGGGGTVTVGVAPPYTTPPSGSSSGGGTGSTASPYLLFASNYVTYSGQQADGAYLHSAQGGDVITGFSDTKNDGSTFNYGCYSSAQSQINSSQLYSLQVKVNGIYNGATNTCTSPATGTVPSKVTDYAFIAIHAPGSAGVTPIPPMEISQSTHLLIQMGNTYNASYNNNLPGGHATVFTVEMSDAADGDSSKATNDCKFDQRLGGVGAGIFTALGVVNYAIALNDPNWSCGPGSMSALMASGVTAIAVKITADKQTDNAGAPSLVYGEFDVMSIGYIGFTKQLGTLPITGS